MVGIQMFVFRCSQVVLRMVSGVHRYIGSQMFSHVARVALVCPLGLMSLVCLLGLVGPVGLWILWVCGSCGSCMCGRSGGPDEPAWLSGSGWSGVNKRPCLSSAVHYGLLVEIHT